MTFGEKLTRLRKREGLSQEALAERLGVSRQAVSRWEQNTALPDAAKLLPCARLFSVSVEWLLDNARGWEDQTQTAEPAQRTETPAAHGNRPWYIAGGIVTGAGALGLVAMGIMSAVFPAVVSEAPVGVEWVRVYDGLTGFLKLHNVEWLFALWAAVALYGVGQTAWYVQQGRMQDLPLLALFLAAAVWCTVRQFLRLGGEPDAAHHWRERVLTLLYTAAQAVILLLTAEAGFGLVALVCHIGVYFLCAGVMTGRRPGRRKS